MTFGVYIHQFDIASTGTVNLKSTVNPSAEHELANKAYVDATVAAGGGEWFASVLDQLDAPPSLGAGDAGKRYLVGESPSGVWLSPVNLANNIVEWTGTAWETDAPDTGAPTAGAHVYVEDTGKTLVYRTSPSSGWVVSASASGALIAANNLSDLDNVSNARTNLGLGSLATASSVNLGSDVTGALPVANGGTGSATAPMIGLVTAADAAAARTVIGAGTIATQDFDAVSITGGAISGITALAVADGGTGASDATTARSNLGLGSIATQADNNVAITGGSISGITDIAIADGGTGASDATTARTNLGLGSIATQAANSVTITGGAISGITDLAVADGGTGASDAATARSNLGVGTSDSPEFASVTVSAAPSSASDLANKSYVDSVAEGLDVKASVRLATTASIAGTYSGDAITVSDAGVLAIDGGNVQLNDRILLKNQDGGSGTSAAQAKYNGIYKCTTAGAAGTGFSPNTSAPLTAGQAAYSSTAANLNITNFASSPNQYASNLEWSSYQGATITIPAGAKYKIITSSGHMVFISSGGPESFTNNSSKYLYNISYSASESTLTSINSAEVTSIEYFERTQASLVSEFTGSLDSSSTSIGLLGSWSGSTLSAPFFIQYSDYSSNLYYWRVTADVNNGDTSVSVAYDLDDSYDAYGNAYFPLGGSSESADVFESQAGGSPVAAVLTRASDFNADADVTSGAFTFVEEGTVNDNAGFVLITAQPITLNTTALDFEQFNGAENITAGDGLEKSGNVLSVDLKANSGLVIDSGEVAVNLSASAITGTLAVGDGGTGLSTVAQDHLIYTSSADTFAAASLTAAGRALLDDADAAAQRTTLGLGTSAVVDVASSVGAGANSKILQVAAAAALSSGDLLAIDASGNIVTGSAGEQGTVTSIALADDDGDTTSAITEAGSIAVVGDGTIVTTNVNSSDQLEIAVASASTTAEGVAKKASSTTISGANVFVGFDAAVGGSSLGQGIMPLINADGEIIFDTASTGFYKNTAGSGEFTSLDGHDLEGPIVKNADVSGQSAFLDGSGSSASLPSTVAALKGMYAYDLGSAGSDVSLNLPTSVSAADIGATVTFKVQGLDTGRKLTINAGSVAGGAKMLIDGSSDADNASVDLDQPRQSITLHLTAVLANTTESTSVMCWSVI